MKGKLIARVTTIGLLCSVLVFMACTPQQAVAPTARAPTSAPAGAQLQGWEADWETTLAAAKKEGPLNIYSAAASDVRQAIAKSVKEKYGLDIEWTAGKAADLAEKVLVERRAGLYLADFLMGGATRQLTTFKPGGMLDPIKPLLVLPEVLDKTLWFNGDIPWVDNEKMYQINSTLSPDYKVNINTTMVKPDEIKSMNDLLDPRWKGKILAYDIAANPKLFSQIALVMGPDWWRKLVATGPTVVNDSRLVYEWLAQGKYPVLLGGRPDVLAEFVRAGASIAKLKVREASFLGGAQINTSLLKRAPHPNAAKVFANWYLSKEGATVQSTVSGMQSARLDVPTNILTPDMLRDPSAQYVNSETEDFYRRMDSDRAVAAQIFAPLLK